VVDVQGERIALHISADHDGSTITFADHTHLRVTSDWQPGQALARLMVDGHALVMKVGKVPMGFRLRLRGADLKVLVRSPRAAELSNHMLEKAPPDTSKYLLCPMPGLLVTLAVAVGDDVEEGQTLATVEAMKMENILKATRSGVVKAVKAVPGASLKVDDIILEFV